ncbi:MAG TPA: MarR family transcriptional regulator [Sphingomicrobium sp.]|nr:MarR family transcriptional regulator [Sphingomicrobium sp.]
METRSDSDFVRDLAYLALGTRFKRLGDLLQAGVAEAFAVRGVGLLPSQVPIMVALRRRPGLGISELVDQLGISQPAVSRAAGTLRRQGILVLAADPNDRRSRSAMLTRKGEQALAALEAAMFGRIAAAAEELCADLGSPLLAQLEQVENRLKTERFAARLERQR